MAKIKKVISFLLLISFILNPFCITASADDENKTWSLEIESVSLKDDLYTEETIINYDGSTQLLQHHNTPSSGMVYAIVTINAKKENILADALDASNFKLKISGAEYSRLSDDSFLAYHNYNVFSAAEDVTISSRGTICFEVPEDYINASALGWIVYNGTISSTPYQGETSVVPVTPNIVEEQSEIEDYLLAVYEQNGKASIENPFVELDPYGTAPLSALVMFETETASNVSVTVKGKNGAKDFTYTLAEVTTHHEVPIIGLYADYNNQVIISDGNQTKTIEIKTDPLPSDMAEFQTTSETGTVLENGFVFIAGYYRMLIDTSGEVRWYTSITVSHDPADMDLVSVDGGVWFSTDKYLNGAVAWNLSWLGKINYNWSWASAIHHDGCEIDGKFLYIAWNEIRSFDLSTGEDTSYFVPATVMDSKVDSLEIRNTRGDWLHPNTISYADGYLYLSFRNQHMVLKMNYQTKEIMWVATPASGRTEAGDIYAIQKDVVDKIVLPAEGDSDFEWFYSQHQIVPLPDIDNNPNTDDFTVFDNGQERGVYGLYEGLTNKNDFYSRIVHYRVDNETKTIKQIFEYGKDASPSLSSYYYGSAQYISEPNENMYLGCFGMLDFANGTEYGKQQGSKIVAVTDEGKQECLWYFPDEYTYRAHYLSMSDFSSISAPALGTPGKALYESNNSWTTWSEPGDNQAVRYGLSDISQQKDGKVTVTGWAYLERNANQYRQVYLVAKNAENAYKINLIQRDNMIPTSESVASS